MLYILFLSVAMATICSCVTLPPLALSIRYHCYGYQCSCVTVAMVSIVNVLPLPRLPLFMQYLCRGYDSLRSLVRDATSFYLNMYSVGTARDWLQCRCLLLRRVRRRPQHNGVLHSMGLGCCVFGKLKQRD